MLLSIASAGPWILNDAIVHDDRVEPSPRSLPAPPFRCARSVTLELSGPLVGIQGDVASRAPGRSSTPEASATAAWTNERLDIRANRPVHFQIGANRDGLRPAVEQRGGSTAVAVSKCGLVEAVVDEAIA